MHCLNNVSRQTASNGNVPHSTRGDISGGEAFHWSLQQPMMMTPPSKRLELALPCKPGVSNFGKAQSMEFFTSPTAPASVYRCYSLPMGSSSGIGNCVNRSFDKLQQDNVRRKVPRNEHDTSRTYCERARVAAMRTDGCDVSARAVRSSCYTDERRILGNVDSNAIRPALCPNIMHMSMSTPGFLQPANFNFRRLNRTAMISEGREMESLRWHIANSLKRHGVCVINRFMGVQTGEIVSHEVKSLHNDRVCSSGRSMGKTSAAKPVREDLVTWLDGAEPQYPNIGALCAKLDAVVGSGTGVTENYSICGSTKAMVARYKGNGASYQLHVDNPSKDGRCLTCIYYVNKGWDSKKMGGSLKLYAKTSGKTADISPIFDRVVFFYSDSRNPHEVLPSYEDRYAITVWYFDLAERTKAIERLRATYTQS